MTSRFFTSLLASLALVGGASFAAATEAPDFSSILAQLNAPAPAAATQAQDVDFSKAETSVSAYVASIERQVNEAQLPFTKLAQQFIWGSDRLFKSRVATGEVGMAAGQRPFIMVGGYWDTQIRADTGGLLTLLCYASDPDGDLTEVELYFNQAPTGAFLQDNGTQGDFAANDGVYGIQAPIAPPNLLQAGQYLLELVARDAQGNESDMWPYLTIN